MALKGEVKFTRYYQIDNTLWDFGQFGATLSQFERISDNLVEHNVVVGLLAGFTVGKLVNIIICVK